MTDHELFSREHTIIEEAKELLQSEGFSDNALYEPFCNLLEAYKKLFRQTKRLVKMGDRMQNDLNELNSELQAHKEKLTQMSYVDGLTSLANRRRFNEFLEAEWNRAVRNSNIRDRQIDVDILYSLPYAHPHHRFNLPTGGSPCPDTPD